MNNKKSENQTLDALIDTPPTEVFQRRAVFPRFLSVVLLNLLTAFLLTGCFTVTSFNLGWLGWFALVPWTIALTGSRNGKHARLWAWAAGLVFWLMNLWWLTWITGIGYIALVFYMSLYWLAAAWIFAGSLQKKLSDVDMLARSMGFAGISASIRYKRFRVVLSRPQPV